MRFDYFAEYKHVRIRPLEERDIEKIRIWRNDSDNTDFLRDIGEITPEMQLNWYKKDIEDDTSCTFAIEEISELNRIVGSVAIYEIHGNRAEIGKILIGDKDAKGKKIGFIALILAMHVAFEKMGIENLYGDVHENNMSAKTNDLRAGFIITGQHPFYKGGIEYEMILPKNHFYETHDFTDEFSIKTYRMNGFCVGDKGEYSKTITDEDVMAFANISGDYNPIHIDEEAAENSIFGKRVCHGMLSASFISTVIGTIMPGPGAIYLSQNIKFVSPVYLGDTLKAVVTIKEIVDTKGILKLETIVLNQEDKNVITGEATVKVW